MTVFTLPLSSYIRISGGDQRMLKKKCNRTRNIIKLGKNKTKSNNNDGLTKE